MLIRLLSSCTSKKAVSNDAALTIEDAKQDAEHLKSREAELHSLQRSASEMYTGQQHRHLMRGLEQVRCETDHISFDLGIISAFYGLIREKTPIVPYECTFSNMKTSQLHSWADHLGIPGDVRAFLSREADLTMVLLGESYIRAARFDTDVSFGGPTLILCARSVAERLPEWSNAKKVILSRQEAKRFSQGLVWIKGWVAQQLLARLARHKTTIDDLMDENIDVLDIIDERDQQLGLYEHN